MGTEALLFNQERETMDFTDIEDNNARTEALAEFVDIIKSMPYRSSARVAEAIKDRVIINQLEREALTMEMPCRVTDQWDKEPDGTEDILGYISDFNDYLMRGDYDGEAPIKTIETTESPWVTAEARKKAAEQQQRIEEIVEGYRKLFSK